MGDNLARGAADICERNERERVDDTDVLVDADVIGVFVGVDDDVLMVCLRTSE